MPLAKQYRHQYVPAGDRQADNPVFRNRLYHYLCDDSGYGRPALIDLLAVEFGLRADSRKFFDDQRVEVILSVVSVAANALALIAGDPGRREVRHYYAEKRQNLIAFVRRLFEEEHLAYRIDEVGEVHPLIDDAYQRTRRSAVEALSAARYEGARAAIDSAFAAQTTAGFDTVRAVGDMFFGVETVFKLVVDSNQDLTAVSVSEAFTKIVAARHASSPPAVQQSATRMVNSFAKWADACHPFRHGQRHEEVVSPPPELAILLLSQGAAFVRWLVSMDAGRPPPV